MWLVGAWLISLSPLSYKVLKMEIFTLEILKDLQIKCVIWDIRANRQQIGRIN